MNELKKDNTTIYRLLAVKEEKALIIDCNKVQMPVWKELDFINTLPEASEDDLGTSFPKFEELPLKTQKKVLERFRMVSGVLVFLSDDYLRAKAIESISKDNNISKQTLRSYVIKYLIYMRKEALAPKEQKEKSLTKDEKNMRYALNKYFYTKNKNTLDFTYVQMLKDKYTDAKGLLVPEYPSFYQFRYFYRKTKKLETFYISRNGLKDYQKNDRPLLGDSVQTYSEHIGMMGMVDSTVCDIYLVNENMEVIGRPILTACVDTYSSLCLGFSLGWEGGMYSVNNMLTNIISNKKDFCKEKGILIKKEDWDIEELPLTFITDKGTEYASENFENISELGINIINLPSYRPDLKGPIEKFFDCVQDYFKPYLKGRGIIEKDFQQRGARDYRKDASLTIKDFELILIRCIIFYNTKRILEEFPFSEEMLQKEIRPYASNIWNFCKNKYNPMIKIKKDYLNKIMLPRTIGTYSRNGLIVNGLRYINPDYKELFLKGGDVNVSFDKNDVSTVYLTEGFIEFNLIENRFIGKTLDEVISLKDKQKEIIKREEKEKRQAQIDLSNHILAIRNNTKKGNPSIKNIRENRKAEIHKSKM